METRIGDAFSDAMQGRTTTYLRERDALARFEFFDRWGSPIPTPSGAVRARHRGTNEEVPVYVIAAHEGVPIADLGDRLIVLIAP